MLKWTLLSVFLKVRIMNTKADLPVFKPKAHSNLFSSHGLFYDKCKSLLIFFEYNLWSLYLA